MPFLGCPRTCLRALLQPPESQEPAIRLGPAHKHTYLSRLPGMLLKPDRGTTSRRKLGLIESDEEKSQFSAVRFRAENADFGEDSRILAVDAAEKPVEQTGWRRAQS